MGAESISCPMRAWKRDMFSKVMHGMISRVDDNKQWINIIHDHSTIFFNFLSLIHSSMKHSWFHSRKSWKLKRSVSCWINQSDWCRFNFHNIKQASENSKKSRKSCEENDFRKQGNITDIWQMLTSEMRRRRLQISMTCNNSNTNSNNSSEHQPKMRIENEIEIDDPVVGFDGDVLVLGVELRWKGADIMKWWHTAIEWLEWVLDMH